MNRQDLPSAGGKVKTVAQIFCSAVVRVCREREASAEDLATDLAAFGYAWRREAMTECTGNSVQNVRDKMPKMTTTLLLDVSTDSITVLQRKSDGVSAFLAGVKSTDEAVFQYLELKRLATHYSLELVGAVLKKVRDKVLSKKEAKKEKHKVYAAEQKKKDDV